MSIPNRSLRPFFLSFGQKLRWNASSSAHVNKSAFMCSERLHVIVQLCPKQEFRLINFFFRNITTVIALKHPHHSQTLTDTNDRKGLENISTELFKRSATGRG